MSLAPSRRLPLLLVVCLSLSLACQSPAPPAPAAPVAPVPAAALPAPPPPAPTVPFRRAADGTPLPPIAKVVPTSRQVLGRTLWDDYGWLRERENPEVTHYLEQENLYTEAVMEPTRALEEQLYQELVGRIQETDLSVPYRKGGFYYYDRHEEGGEYPILCRRRVTRAGEPQAPEEVMLDVNALAQGLEYFSLGSSEVSPDGRLLAYAFDDDGSEYLTVRVKDLATGELLADEISGAAYGLAWANDNRTLFYVTHDEAHRPYRLFRHPLGGRPGDDVLLYEETDAAFEIYVTRSKDGRVIFLGGMSNTTSEWRFLPADQPTARLQLFAARRPGVEYWLEHHGQSFFVRTNDGAKNFRLLAVPEADLDPARWQEVIPAREDLALTGFEVFAHHLAVFVRRGGFAGILVRDLASGAEHEVDFPEPVYTVWPGANEHFETSALRFRYTSMVTPGTVFDYDMAARTRELRKQETVRGGYDPAAYLTERLSARAGDGTEIPISVVYRKDRPRDGSGPCLLTGYGAYGAPTDPVFNPNRLSLLDRGFCFAIAHVRGGGETGETWHDSGKLLAKKNTFTDFVAAAERLVRAGYSTPERLTISGGSAGGLLVGAVVNLRPDLFRAAIARVPFVDVMNTMLDPTLPLVVPEYEEWGNPNEPAFFDAMRAYSPYDNVAPVEYPHLLVTAGFNDPRVSYWEPAKWVAKLRATRKGDRMLLLKTHLGAGHAGASGRYGSLSELAMEYAFLLWAVGAPTG